MNNRFELSDLIKHVERYVTGALVEYYEATGQAIEANDNFSSFNAYRRATVEVCVRYLRRGQSVLDGSCSDIQCSIALECRAVLGMHTPD